ncbi:MAG: AsmA family protein, partial [Bryobacteraceae bacterium]
MKAETLKESGVAELRAKRRSGWRIVLRAGIALLLAILIAGIIAPHIDAERFSNPIRRALEAWLGRKVQFQAVHFTLFSGPGFSLENVLIQEDPRYGLEPFADVPSLDARISWSKLLLGKIRFSSLKLDDPLLNFAKDPGGTWNVLDLARRLGASNTGGMNFSPAFEVSAGRIDFRFGTRKTILYLADCDFSVSPD